MKSMQSSSENPWDNLLLKTPLARAVALPIGGFFMSALVLMGIFQFIFSMDSENLWIFFCLECSVFLFCYIWLMLNLKNLRNIESDQSLPSLNAANLVTLSRFFFVPVIAKLLWEMQPSSGIFMSIMLLAGIGYLVLSDLADGLIARRFHQVTQVGSYLDPMSDLFLGLVFTCLLSLRSFLPWAVFAVVLLKIITTIGAALFYIQMKLAAPGLRSTIIGKISVVAIMLAILTATFKTFLWWPAYPGTFLTIFYYLCVAVVIISIGEKIFHFRQWRKRKNPDE